MKHLAILLSFTCVAVLLASCSSLSSTRQLSPDREPAVPLSDSTAPRPDSLNRP